MTTRDLMPDRLIWNVDFVACRQGVSRGGRAGTMFTPIHQSEYATKSLLTYKVER